MSGPYREPSKPVVKEKPGRDHKGCQMGGVFWYVQFPSVEPPRGFRRVAMYICDGCACSMSPQAYAVSM